MGLKPSISCKSHLLEAKLKAILHDFKKIQTCPDVIGNAVRNVANMYTVENGC